MTTEIKTSVAKLNGDNYFMWKFKIEMLLIREGEWNALSKEKPEKDADDWVHKYNIATISLSVEEVV